MQRVQGYAVMAVSLIVPNADPLGQDLGGVYLGNRALAEPGKYLPFHSRPGMCMGAFRDGLLILGQSGARHCLKRISRGHFGSPFVDFLLLLGSTPSVSSRPSATDGIGQSHDGGMAIDNLRLR